jgi:hypothetical protein
VRLGLRALREVVPLAVEEVDPEIRHGAEVDAVRLGQAIVGPVEHGEAEDAVGSLVLHDAPEDGARKRVTRRMPGRAQERDGDRLANAEEADRELARAEERVRIGGCVEDDRVGVVTDLGSAAALHRHARAQLDVHHLVEREARGDADEIDRRACLEEGAEGGGTCDGRAVLLVGGSGPRAPRSDEVLLGRAGEIHRSPRHRLHLGAHLAIPPLGRAAEDLELEEIPLRVHRAHFLFEGPPASMGGGGAGRLPEIGVGAVAMGCADVVGGVPAS